MSETIIDNFISWEEFHKIYSTCKVAFRYDDGTVLNYFYHENHIWFYESTLDDKLNICKRDNPNIKINGNKIFPRDEYGDFFEIHVYALVPWIFHV